MSTIPHAMARPSSRSRASVLRWIAGGALACAVIAALTIALWPTSATDRAYDDGQRVGQAVSDLGTATTTDEVDSAMTDVRGALDTARDHASDDLSAQITDQGDALSRALDGFTGAFATTDDWDQSLYEYELDTALDDLTSQADHFRSQAPEVDQAFYDGLQAGLGA